MTLKAGVPAFLLVSVGLLASMGLSAQEGDVDPEMLAAVLPAAERFSEREGRPRVMRGFAIDPATGEERLVGFAFLTSDVPPERKGYSGPVEALVGMGLDGVITGVRVVSYYESYKSQMGDFLRRDGHQEQYTGKSIGEQFLVRGDIDGISRATVSSRALARGVRDASRRVATAYLERAPPPDEIPDPAELSWIELVDRDVVKRIEIHEGDDILTEISVVHIDGPATGERLVGSAALGMAQRAIERRGGEGHIMAYGVDGPDRSAFSRSGWAVVQGGDTLRIDEGAVFPFGLAGGGLLQDEMATMGGMILPADVDLARAFTLQLDLRPERDVFGTEYAPLEARRVEKAARDAQAAAASAEAESAASTQAEPAASEPAASEPAASARAEPAGSASAASLEDVPVAAAPPEPASSESAALAEPTSDLSADDAEAPAAESAAPARPVDPGDSPPAVAVPGGPSFPRPIEEQSVLAEALAGVDWTRTAAVGLLLLLVSAAFALKREGLRWLTLAVTFGYLGFIDGGFLSVSHITSAIWVGPSAFVNDLPLLLVAAFTVITTLVFGRVFCGFLCPFGALQDILTRLVPRRFRRRVPEAMHRRALWIKYGVLAVILVPALAGSRASIYPYFEPFGTVFFLSPSVLLWGIAIAFIAASAVIPRFYCRYACPLGAALALGSLVAPKRIARVEHCTLCKVCEHACPTGAVRGAEIDFKECVRCNACETLLIERAGVCGHDLADVRTRLVQLQVPASRDIG